MGEGELPGAMGCQVRGWVAGMAVVSLLCVAGHARADEIVVKGDKLRGTVVTITPKTVVFETTYGKGKLEIAIEDVESITTDGSYVISHGEDGTSQGRVVGIEEDVLLVGETREGAERVQLSEIQIVQTEAAVEESPIAAAKTRLRYWTGNLDLGVNLAQGTVDTTQFSVGLGAKRTKGPTRLIFKSAFLYGTQQKQGETETKLADQIYGNARGEYDLTERFYGYGNGYAEYNAVQHLSIRGIPEAGVGYKFWKSDEKDSTDFIAGTVGGSWVYEQFFGGLDQDYVAIAFGGEAQLTLPYDAKLAAGVSYLPSVSDFANDYLIKSQVSLAVPVYEQLSFKISLADDYDNTPAPDTTRNYLTLLFGLSASL